MVGTKKSCVAMLAIAFIGAACLKYSVGAECKLKAGPLSGLCDGDSTELVCGDCNGPFVTGVVWTGAFHRGTDVGTVTVQSYTIVCKETTPCNTRRDFWAGCNEEWEGKQICGGEDFEYCTTSYAGTMINSLVTTFANDYCPPAG